MEFAFVSAFRDNSSFGLNILGPLCLWQCLLFFTGENNTIPPDVAVRNEKKRIKIKLAEYSKSKAKSKAICARIEKATTKAEKEKANADCDESHNKTLAICSNGECDLFRKPRNWTLEEHIFRGRATTLDWTLSKNGNWEMTGGCGNRTEPGIYYDGNDIRKRERV